jgi:hypothetical protein
LKLAREGGPAAELCAMTQPAHLRQIDKNAPSRVVITDLPVVGPVPYRGGEITLELGLLAVNSGDLAQPYLDLLGAVSRSAGQAFISQALPIVGLVKSGVERLLGIADAQKVEVGLLRGWSSPSTGTFVLATAPASTSIDELRLDPETYRPLPQADKALSGSSWVIFSLETSVERHDWGQLPDLRAAHDRLRRAGQDGKLAELKSRFEEFRRLALYCPDLIDSDAKRLVQREDERMREAINKPQTTGSGGVDIGPFESLNLYGHA